MKKNLLLVMGAVLLACLSLSSCNSNESTGLAEVGYEGNPTTLTGRWNMVKVDDAEGSTDIPDGQFVITFLDNGYAVVNNTIHKYFLSSGNYPYQADGNRITFQFGGFVGQQYYSYEFKEGGMLLFEGDSRICFKKVKHADDFNDINYDELKYQFTRTDTLVIASHMFYDTHDTPFYLIRYAQPNLDNWFEYCGEIEGFHHTEGYEVKAIVWSGTYGGGCVMHTDMRLVNSLDRKQKQSENIPDYYWKQSQPGWAQR